MPFVFQSGERARTAITEYVKAAEKLKDQYTSDKEAQRQTPNKARVALIDALHAMLLQVVANRNIHSAIEKHRVAVGAICHARMSILRDDYDPTMWQAYTQGLFSSSNSDLLKLLHTELPLTDIDKDTVKESLKSFYDFYKAQCFDKASNPLKSILNLNLEQYQRRICRWADPAGHNPDASFAPKGSCVGDTQRMVNTMVDSIPELDKAIQADIDAAKAKAEAEAVAKAKPEATSTSWLTKFSLLGGGHKKADAKEEAAKAADATHTDQDVDDRAPWMTNL